MQLRAKSLLATGNFKYLNKSSNIQYYIKKDKNIVKPTIEI